MMKMQQFGIPEIMNPTIKFELNIYIYVDVQLQYQCHEHNLLNNKKQKEDFEGQMICSNKQILAKLKDHLFYLFPKIQSISYILQLISKIGQCISKLYNELTQFLKPQINFTINNNDLIIGRFLHSSKNCCLKFIIISQTLLVVMYQSMLKSYFGQSFLIPTLYRPLQVTAVKEWCRPHPFDADKKQIIGFQGEKTIDDESELFENLRGNTQKDLLGSSNIWKEENTVKKQSSTFAQNLKTSKRHSEHISPFQKYLEESEAKNRFSFAEAIQQLDELVENGGELQFLERLDRIYKNPPINKDQQSTLNYRKANTGGNTASNTCEIANNSIENMGQKRQPYAYKMGGLQNAPKKEKVYRRLKNSIQGQCVDYCTNTQNFPCSHQICS